MTPPSRAGQQALELRDHATGGHTRRILETTITLAR
jgi:hypothetical protein